VLLSLTEIALELFTLLALQATPYLNVITNNLLPIEHQHFYFYLAYFIFGCLPNPINGKIKLLIKSQTRRLRYGDDL